MLTDALDLLTGLLYVEGPRGYGKQGNLLFLLLGARGVEQIF